MKLSTRSKQQQKANKSYPHARSSGASTLAASPARLLRRATCTRCVRRSATLLSDESCSPDPPARPADTPGSLVSSSQPLWLPPPCGLHRHPLRHSRSQAALQLIAAESCCPPRVWILLLLCMTAAVDFSHRSHHSTTCWRCANMRRPWHGCMLRAPDGASAAG